MDIFLLIVSLIILIPFLIVAIASMPHNSRKAKREEEFRAKYGCTSHEYIEEKIIRQQQQRTEVKPNISNWDIKSVPEKFNKKYVFMVFDTETTGLPSRGRAYIIQLSWMLIDEKLNVVKEANYYIKPPIHIPEEATAINHITDEIVEEKGKPIKEVLEEFYEDAYQTYKMVAHNFEFDSAMIDFERDRAKMRKRAVSNMPHICTMKQGTNYCQIMTQYGKYKYPKLTELAKECRIKIPDDMHNSMTDVKVTYLCLLHMLDSYVIRVKNINW